MVEKERNGEDTRTGSEESTMRCVYFIFIALRPPTVTCDFILEFPRPRYSPQNLTTRVLQSTNALSND